MRGAFGCTQGLTSNEPGVFQLESLMILKTQLVGKFNERRGIAAAFRFLAVADSVEGQRMGAIEMLWPGHLRLLHKPAFS